MAVPDPESRACACSTPRRPAGRHCLRAFGRSQMFHVAGRFLTRDQVPLPLGNAKPDQFGLRQSELRIRRSARRPPMLRAQMREVFQTRDILIEQVIGRSALDDALRGQQIDVLPRAAEVPRQLIARDQHSRVRCTVAALRLRSIIRRYRHVGHRSIPQKRELHEFAADRTGITSPEFTASDTLDKYRLAVPAGSYAPGSTLATMLPVAEGRHRRTVTASAHRVAFSMSCAVSPTGRRAPPRHHHDADRRPIADGITSSSPTRTMAWQAGHFARLNTSSSVTPAGVRGFVSFNSSSVIDVTIRR